VIWQGARGKGTVAERWINGEQGGELRFEAVEEVLCVGEAELGLEQLIARTSSVRPTCGVDRGVQCRQRATVHRSPTHTTEPAGRGASAAHLCPNCPHASAPPLVSTHARSRVGPYASAPTRQPSLVSPNAPDQRVCPRASVVPTRQPFRCNAWWNVCHVARAAPILCCVRHQAPRPTLSTALRRRKRERGALGEGRDLHSHTCSPVS
jgi:hypothetical protein